MKLIEIWNPEKNVIKKYSDILVVTNEKWPNAVLLCSVANLDNNIMLTRDELMNLYNTSFNKHKYYSDLMIRKIKISLCDNLFIMTEKERILQFDIDNLNRMINYFKEKQMGVIS